MINGLSWPSTERLTYRVGEPVRWRVINLSSQIHPMHLHGFYFRVQRLGDGVRDEAVAGAEGRRVVTQMVPSSGTMTMAVDAGAGRQLAVPLPRHAPRRRPSAGCTAADTGRGGARTRTAGITRTRTTTRRSAWPAWCSASPCPTATTRPRAPAAATTATPRQLTMTIRGGSADGRTPAGIDVTGDGVRRRRRRRVAGPAAGAAPRRAGRDHAGQQPRRGDVDALARPRARQLLRRRARLERRWARRSRR